MKIVAFVPIKLNNQRLPGKNTMMLHGRPMCDYLFHTLTQVDAIDDKYVFCSDPSIQRYMPAGLTFLQREKWLDGDTVRGLTIIEEFVKLVDADIYVLTHVTAPFVKRSSFENAIDKVKNGGYDSAFTAEEVREYFWHNGKPANYDPTNIVQTQGLEPIYIEGSGFFIFKKEVFTQHHRRIGFKPYIQVCDRFENVDVDTKNDFDFACAVAAYLDSAEGAAYKDQ